MLLIIWCFVMWILKSQLTVNLKTVIIIFSLFIELSEFVVINFRNRSHVRYWWSFSFFSQEKKRQKILERWRHERPFYWTTIIYSGVYLMVSRLYFYFMNSNLTYPNVTQPFLRKPKLTMYSVWVGKYRSFHLNLYLFSFG